MNDYNERFNGIDNGHYDSEKRPALTADQIADLCYPGEGTAAHAAALDKQFAAGKRIYSADLRKADVSTAQTVKKLRRGGGLVASGVERIEIPKAANDDDYADGETADVEVIKKRYYERPAAELERAKTDPDGQRTDALRIDALRKVKRLANEGLKACYAYGYEPHPGMYHDAVLDVPDVGTGSSHFTDVQTWGERTASRTANEQPTK